MTELARRFFDTVQRRLAVPPPDPAAGQRSMPVEIGLPPTVPADVADDVRRQLSVLLDELALDRTPVVTAREDDSGYVTVAVDGRPVAYLSDGPDLSRRVMSRVLRRLSLLAGPSVHSGSTAAYLLSLGCRVPAGTGGRSLDVDQAEGLLDARADERIVVQVAAATVRRVDEQSAGAVVELRKAEFRRRGVVYPDVRVELTDAPPGSVRLRFNDVTLPERRLGSEAGWNDVVRYLGEELAGLRHWFVRMRDVAQVLDEDLLYVLPDLVAVAQSNYSRAQITACMRELVRSGRRMRNFPRILWLLVEAGGSPAGTDVLRLSESPLLPKARHRPPAERDPIAQAARVRKLAAEEDWRLGNYRAAYTATRVAAEVEARLCGSQPDPAAEWALVRAFAAQPLDRVLTHTVAGVGMVRDVLHAVEFQPRVRTSHELPPDADIGALPVLGASS